MPERRPRRGDRLTRQWHCHDGGHHGCRRSSSRRLAQPHRQQMPDNSLATSPAVTHTTHRSEIYTTTFAVTTLHAQTIKPHAHDTDRPWNRPPSPNKPSSSSSLSPPPPPPTTTTTATPPLTDLQRLNWHKPAPPRTQVASVCLSLCLSLPPPESNTAREELRGREQATRPFPPSFGVWREKRARDGARLEHRAG